MDVGLGTTVALTAVATVAGCVDAIAGGGGLLTLPALLTAGVPAPLALGTNKGQSVFGSGAALIDALAALLNNGMAVYEMGGAATPHELAVVGWMARTLGLPAAAGGLLTSGGSLGNLTALLAARAVASARGRSSGTSRKRSSTATAIAPPAPQPSMRTARSIE